MRQSVLPSIKRVMNEGGTLLLDLTHRNASGVLTAPTSLSYRIDDLTNPDNETSNREILDWTVFASPQTKNTITITAAQNTLEDRDLSYEVRQITTRAVDASGNPDQTAFRYKILRIFEDAGALFP